MTRTAAAMLILGLFLLERQAVSGSYGPDLLHCPENKMEAVMFSWDETVGERVIVVASPAKQEVLIWTLNNTLCHVKMAPAYVARSSFLCDSSSNIANLFFNLTRLERADEGNYSCHDSAVVGALIPSCGQRLIFQDVERVSSKCGYHRAERTVTCRGLHLTLAQSLVIQDSDGKTVHRSQSRDLEYHFPGNVRGNFSCSVAGPAACSDVFGIVVQSGSLPVASGLVTTFLAILWLHLLTAEIH